jgi:archaellum component FlaC
VEALTKEKAQLTAALEEKNAQFNQIMAEKADVESELERFREKFQGSSKTLEELEKKLDDAEREAKGVQEEYMALYARNQREKEGFQKK